MLTQGPYALTAGTPLVLPDPGSKLGYSNVKLQIQNSSGFELQATIGVLVVPIPAFNVTTIPLTGEATSVTLTPAATGLSSGTKTVTVVWLLANDNPAGVAGPLPGAPLLSGLEGQGLAGSGPLTVITTGAVLANATGAFS